MSWEQTIEVGTVVEINAFGMKCLLLASSYNIKEFVWIGIENAGEAVLDSGGSCSQSSAEKGACPLPHNLPIHFIL